MGIGSVFFGQDSDDILCGLAKIGGVSDLWEVQRLWEELESVCVPSGRSGWDIATTLFRSLLTRDDLLRGVWLIVASESSWVPRC